MQENRNCGCMYNSSMGMNNLNINTTNMSMNNSNMNMKSDSCGCQKISRQDMLEKIKSYTFAIIELALYLDTHEDDTRALCLHKEYCKELKNLRDKYQKVYGPLTIEYPCNKWRWLEEPWPWEGGIV